MRARGASFGRRLTGARLAGLPCFSLTVRTSHFFHFIVLASRRQAPPEID